ncbi:MAG: stage II sporulation protein M [Acidimicrobiia bacterium]
MDLSTFERSRSADWNALRQLIARGAGATPEEVLRRGKLYRAVAADVAYVRRRFPDEELRGQVESLAAAGRRSVYAKQSISRIEAFQYWVTRGFWQRVRERPGALALSAITLFGPAILIGIWSVRDPGAASRILPNAAFWKGPIIEGASARANAAFGIMLNNIVVTLLCAAGGALAGLFTGISLMVNGVMLGSVVGLAYAQGNGQAALEWIPAHGGIELSCIVIGGAAGYRLGAAILAPGQRKRRVAIAEEGRAMVQIIGGVSLLLIVAGLLEGFVSPAYLGTPVVITIGAVTAGALWTGVFVLGRPSEPEVPQERAFNVRTRQRALGL